MNSRIEAYIVLGAYFAIGLFFGYLIGKDSDKDYLNVKTNQTKPKGGPCRQN